LNKAPSHTPARAGLFHPPTLAQARPPILRVRFFSKLLFSRRSMKVALRKGAYWRAGVGR
jgi:hypothetical protein